MPLPRVLSRLRHRHERPAQRGTSQLARGVPRGAPLQHRKWPRSPLGSLSTVGLLMHILLSVIFVALLAVVGIGVIIVTYLAEIITRLRAMSTPTVSISTNSRPPEAAVTRADFAQQARRIASTRRKGSKS